MRITNDFKTRSSVQIFQIGERELIAANWRLKEKGYLARELNPSLYTYGVKDGRRSAGFSLLPLSVHPEALFSSPVPL